MSQDKNIKSNGAANSQINFVFGKLNYILFIIGIVVLAIGYILLCGGGSDDPSVFNPAMFDNRRLVAAPVTIVIGFVIEIFAIMLPYKGNKSDNKKEASK